MRLRILVTHGGFLPFVETLVGSIVANLHCWRGAPCKQRKDPAAMSSNGTVRAKQWEALRQELRLAVGGLSI